MPLPTAPLVLFDNAAGRLSADAEGFLRLNWHETPRQLADLQEVLGQVVLALKQHRWPRMLANQHEMSPFTAEEQTWMTQTWLPRAVHEGGYRYGAIVLARNVFSRLATANITTSVKDLPLIYKSFEDEESARAWLRTR